MHSECTCVSSNLTGLTRGVVKRRYFGRRNRSKSMNSDVPAGSSPAAGGNTGMAEIKTPFAFYPLSSLNVQV